MLDFETADLWDRHGDALLCVDPIFRCYGLNKAFHGEIVTLKVFEDNSLVRNQLEQEGKNRVLVVDGGGSLRCALIGDQLAQLAIDNCWAGLVVNGCIRDSVVIDQMKIGMNALNTSPVKSVKKGLGELGIDVRFGGVRFRTGDFLYADQDGILVSAEKLH
ncbi:MAG: ribonuclease E activity regulator RraA [Flavobacteriales bacterium]|nr:ribonuclease E activity regulator RraA [Flavobacteriales bacterium]